MHLGISVSDLSNPGDRYSSCSQRKQYVLLTYDFVDATNLSFVIWNRISTINEIERLKYGMWIDLSYSNFCEYRYSEMTNQLYMPSFEQQNSLLIIFLSFSFSSMLL